MKKLVSKPEKISLCQQCKGTGLLECSDGCSGGVCPGCEGSGRVWVACDMVIHIRPFVN